MTAPKTTEAHFNRFLKSAQAIKDAVPLVDYCGDRGIALRASGNRFEGLCPLHSEKSPSFAVYSNQRYYCFGCKAYGDVLELHQRLEGLSSVSDAVMSLAMEYDVELPERSGKWCRRQDDKGRVRKTARIYIAQVYQRRLTRLYAPLVLVGGETPEEELEELAGLASALWPIALDMAERRMSIE
jgi:DNA primase